MTPSKREPLRVSANRSDKAYRVDAYRFEVFCDGKSLPDCRTADEEKGFAEVYERGADGEFLFRAGVPVIREVFGRIEILVRQDAYSLAAQKTDQATAIKIIATDDVFPDVKIDSIRVDLPDQPCMKISGTVSAGDMTTDLNIISASDLITIYKTFTPNGISIKSGVRGYTKEEGFNDLHHT